MPKQAPCHTSAYIFGAQILNNNFFVRHKHGCYLAGGHSRSTSANHGITDSVVTPVLFALSRGEQRQGGLLEEAWAC